MMLKKRIIKCILRNAYITKIAVQGLKTLFRRYFYNRKK